MKEKASHYDKDSRRLEVLSKSGLVIGERYREYLSNCVVELEELVNGGLARCRVVELPAAAAVHEAAKTKGEENVLEVNAPSTCG